MSNYLLTLEMVAMERRNVLGVAARFLLGAVCWSVCAGETEPFDQADSLRWGPYRPHMYLGIRPLVPKTLLMGLMWGHAENHSASRAPAVLPGNTFPLVI